MQFGFIADASGIIDSLHRMAIALESTSGPVGDAKEEMGEEYLEAMRERFQRDGDGTWEPLAKNTQLQRKRAGYGEQQPILNQTGDLLASLYPGGDGNVLNVLSDGVDAGTSLPKSAPLHFGVIDRKLPARPILVDPPQQVIDKMAQIVSDRLTESIK